MILSDLSKFKNCKGSGRKGIKIIFYLNKETVFLDVTNEDFFYDFIVIS